MRNFILFLLGAICLFNCNKVEKMKNKILPDRSYEEAKIDNFYWADSGWDYTLIPLIKPYKIQQLQGSEIWMLDANNPSPKIEIFHGKNTVLSSFDPVESFNVKDGFIYGSQGEKLDFDEKETFPKIWFIINTKTKEVHGFETEKDFKAELKKLNLPEEFLSPDAVYEQYKKDPALPWFPEDIKKQLEEVKQKTTNNR
ncbi:hypothetical protein [Chryseobacterium gossypii]|uniref:hypothetical protein n=1 Tax=Chryseobacterium gossypii TaxID=3231602 RepID=UPI0035261056